MNADSKIYVAGHRGLVGRAIWRELEAQGFRNLVGRRHVELDLTDQDEVRSFFWHERPEYIFLAAAKVGGIEANRSQPAEFINENLMIQANVIREAADHQFVKKLLNLGSSCIYPRVAPQPLKEEYLLSGYLEPTNEWYAVAKIAGLKMCQAFRRQYGCDFINVMPCNLYGSNDNFDLQTSHVVPAMIRKFHEARVAGASEVTMWGTGTPRRELLHVDDLARACVWLMNNYSDERPINVGAGTDITIAEMADIIAEVVGFEGRIVWDRSKPDGTPRKLLDVSRIRALGWSPKIELREGLRSTYQSFAPKFDVEQFNGAASAR